MHKHTTHTTHGKISYRHIIQMTKFSFMNFVTVLHKIYFVWHYNFTSNISKKKKKNAYFFFCLQFKSTVFPWRHCWKQPFV